MIFASNSPPLHLPEAGSGKGKSERAREARGLESLGVGALNWGVPFPNHDTVPLSLKRNNTFHGNM